MVIAFVIGFCFGFFGSIPVAGPIAAIVLKRGLTGRYTSAALVGIGGGVAEAGYAFLTFWGYTTYLEAYPIIDPISRAVAGAILIGLGISFARYRQAEAKATQPGDESLARSFILGFTITALNPTFLATWTGATATLQAMDLFTLRRTDAIPFSGGALAGITSWFMLLTALLKRYGHRFDQRKLATVVRMVGVALLIFGVWLAIKAALYFAR